jgi:predicted amidophosphoribosyltransferase
MARANPRRIRGSWREGYCLDFHTLTSTYVGDDEFGRPQFDTVRSEVGELLYRLKYRSDRSVVEELVETAAAFVQSWNPGVTEIVPVPPSRQRPTQPVLVLAEQIAGRLGLAYLPNAVSRVRDVPELKNLYDYEERLAILAEAHTAARAEVQGQSVLLFDDLYRSGATMDAVTSALLDQGRAAAVFALAITRTRSRT